METNMTFVLKEFDTLKSHFNDTVKIILQREKKDKIEDLPNPRKEELQFLTAVLNQLEAKIDELKPRSLASYVHVFYGAMLLVCKDVENNLRVMEKKENSLLFTRLMDGMGISDENIPTSDQNIMFYRGLNKFLNFIYESNDSRKGLKKEHFLQVLSLKKIYSLAKLSYEQEEAAENNALTKLTADGKTKANANSFHVEKPIDSSIVEQFKSWDEMKGALHQLILDELSDKNVAKISALSQARSAQLKFLQTMAEQLDKIPNQSLEPSEKMAILAGAMYIVRGQIAQEYGKDPLSNDKISATVIHTGLSTILHANADCCEDKEVLIAAANKFIRHMVIERPEQSNKKITKESIRENNMFSDIAGFQLISVLTLIQNMIRTCRTDAIEACVTKRKEELEALKPKKEGYSIASSVTGYVGSWFKKAPSMSEEDEEDDLKDQNTAEETSKPTV
ncbi:TPA: lpg0634 family Dot/Icm T4SS effector [Legionella pneumophila]|nr:lpg0634 family Dot/Icm T4SS effector [Legionella pneumophila]